MVECLTYGSAFKWWALLFLFSGLTICYRHSHDFKVCSLTHFSRFLHIFLASATALESRKDVLNSQSLSRVLNALFVFLGVKS